MFLAGGRSPQETAWAYDWLLSTVATQVHKQEQLLPLGGGAQVASELTARMTDYLGRLPHLQPVVAAFVGDVDLAFERTVGAVIEALEAGALRA